MTKDESRETVYGMPYDEWRAKYQTEASAAQTGGIRKSKRQSIDAPSLMRSSCAVLWMSARAA